MNVQISIQVSTWPRHSLGGVLYASALSRFRSIIQIVKLSIFLRTEHTQFRSAVIGSCACLSMFNSAPLV